MPIRGSFFRLIASLLGASALAMAQGSMSLPQNAAAMKVSDHVYAIMGFPNIGFVVGNRATLVIDTGLGPRNGAIVVREAEKLAKAPNLYLTTTHYHPEHAMGEQAFPPRTVWIRPAAQQQEMNQYGAGILNLFRGMSPENKALLKDVKLRNADIVFDRELTLDLGGVTARLFWMGTAHTQGDEMIMVQPDNVLLSGDIVMNKIAPSMPSAESRVQSWIDILDKLEPLKPRIIFPDHGQLGDASLIAAERACLVDLQKRALALKREGKSVEEAGKLMTAEFKTKYPDWEIMLPVSNIVKQVYAESK
jgi:glyoxylase-like metal-dependent hydrolase (beta-lactamase superfamily II)